MAELELLEIGLLRRHERVHQRTRQPRMRFDVLVLHHDETVDRIDAAAAEPIGLDLFDIGDQFRIGIGRRRPGAALSQPPIGGPARPTPAGPVNPA